MMGWFDDQPVLTGQAINAMPAGPVDRVKPPGRCRGYVEEIIITLNKTITYE
jgi:hypothetical protein